MSHISLRMLLQAARDFIGDIPPFALLNAPRRKAENLVAVIDHALGALPIATVTQAHLLAALHVLSVMEREVYILHRVEDRSLSYVADHLGITIDDAEKILLDALRGLYLAIHGS